MAIKHRRGNYGDFDPARMVQAELAVVISGDTNSPDGKSAYVAFNPGVVKRIAMMDDITEELETAVQGVADEATAQAKEYSEAAEASAEELSESVIQVTANTDIALANTFDTWKYAFPYARERTYTDSSSNELTIRQSQNAMYFDGTTAVSNLRIPLVNNDDFLVYTSDPTYSAHPELYETINWFEVGHTYKVSIKLVSGTAPSVTGPYAITFRKVTDGSSSNIGTGTEFEFECGDKPSFIVITIKAGTYTDALFLLNVIDITEEYANDYLKPRFDAIDGQFDIVNADINSMKMLEYGDWKYVFSDVREREVTVDTSTLSLSQANNLLTVDGILSVTSGILRIPIANNSNFVVTRYVPSYANISQCYADINWFELGHKYKISLYLLSGAITFDTQSDLPYYLELRSLSGTSDSVIIQSVDGEFECTEIPAYMGIGIRNGTYTNATFLINVVDLTKYEIVTPSFDGSDEIKDKLIEDESLLLRHAALDVQYNPKKEVSFIFYSDVHSNKRGITELENFITNYGSYADDVINGGDAARYEFNVSANNNYLASALPNVSLMAIGNHDAAKMTSSGYDWQAYTSKEIYDVWISPFVSQWGVTQPNNASTNGYNYFYKDYHNIVRVVFLDGMFWDNTQLTWFESVLASARTAGLSVIVVTHWCNANFTGDRTCNWTDLDRTDSTEPQHDIFIEDTACDAIDTFIGDGGSFICWLTGHLHRDRIGVLTDYPNQMLFVVNNSGMKETNADARGAFYSATFLTIDTDKKLLKFARYGCNYDSYLRPKYTLCYNYDTKTLIGQS